MSDLFIRKYEIAIARHDAIISKVEKGEVFSSGLAENYLVEKRESIVFTEHQMKADVEYTRKSQGLNSPAIIKIYNVAQASLDKIKEDDTLFLKAGYEGQSLPLLFVGTIKKIFSTRNRSGTLETTIICGDSINPANSLRIAGIAPPNTTYGALIQDLLTFLANNGLPTGNFNREPIENINAIGQEFRVYQQGVQSSTTPTTRTFINGRTYEGTALGELNKICEEINYHFFISLGKIYVQPNFNLLGSTQKRDFLTIKSDMLKNPITPNKDSSGQSESEGDKRGVTMHTFLDGRIKTGIINIELDVEGSYKGDYSIAKVKHILDYEGSDWDTISTIKRQ
jgi:hypothetical protein